MKNIILSALFYCFTPTALLAQTMGPVVPSAVGTAQPGQIPGISGNTAAATGNVGEIVSSLVSSASAVSLTNNVAANVTSVTIAAGDWDCNANGVYTLGTTTNVLYGVVGLSTTSATRSPTPGNESFIQVGTPGANGNTPSAIVGPVQISVSGSTTVYMYAFSGFNTSTASTWGALRCRRMR